MRKQMLRALTISTALAAVLATSAPSVSPAQQPGSSAANAKKGVPQSLRATAQQRDVEVLLTPTGLNLEYTSIESLNKDAIAVVVGRVTSEEAAFDGDDFIISTYTVDVKDVLKDETAGWTRPAWASADTSAPPAPLVTPLKVTRMGGELRVNGNRAAMKLAGAELLKAGKDYAMFLEWSPGRKAYRILGGMSGVFLIRENGRLKPLGVDRIQRYDGMELQSLAGEIRKRT